MEIDIKFFEVAACHIINKSQCSWLQLGEDVTPEDLGMRTRKRKVVVARQLCLYYMVEHMGYKLDEATKRYSLDHATAIYAKKTIRSLRQTDNIFKKDVDTFVKICRDMDEEKKKVVDYVDMLNPDNYGEHRQQIHSAVSNMFFLTHELYLFLNFEDDNGVIYDRIAQCRESLEKLEKLFDVN